MYLVGNPVYTLGQNGLRLVPYDGDPATLGYVLKPIPVQDTKMLKIHTQIFPAGPAYLLGLLGIFGVFQHVQDQPGEKRAIRLSNSALLSGSAWATRPSISGT
jgi:hypothetical protein